jgi:hypothetical protein
VPGLLDTILQRRVAFRRRVAPVAPVVEVLDAAPYEEPVTNELDVIVSADTIMAEELAIEESAPKVRKPRKPRKVAEEVA